MKGPTPLAEQPVADKGIFDQMLNLEFFLIQKFITLIFRAVTSRIAAR